jgi:hypothetical protein
MKAIRGICQEGRIKPLEPIPNVESVSVLIIFPDVSEKAEVAPPSNIADRLFGAGADLWTDEVEASVREVWNVRTRPWDTEAEGTPDASL